MGADVAKLIEQVATSFGLTTLYVEPCFRSQVHVRWCLALFGLGDRPAEPCPPELNQLILKLISMGKLTYDAVKRLGLKSFVYRYVAERVANLLAEARGVAEIEDELTRLRGVVKSALRTVTPELERSIMESVRRSAPAASREQVVAVIEALRGTVSPRDAATVIRGLKPVAVEEESRAERRSQVPAGEVAERVGRSVKPVAG
jgi:hypothetical protein